VPGGAIKLIDIRTAREREDFNIGGEHVPLDMLYPYIDKMDKGAKTVLYCASGKRSGEAVKVIKQKYPDAQRVFFGRRVEGMGGI